MRFAIFSDLHLGIKQNDEGWHQIAFDWCDWFIDSLKKNNIQEIVFLRRFFS